MYTSIIEEADAVRTHCGLFDVSHMGRFFASGENALAELNHVFSRDILNIQVGRQRYTLLLQEDGGILDDLMVARVADQEFLIVANAGNRPKDFHWIESHLGPDTNLIDRSDSTLMLALQGPEAEKVLSEVLGKDLTPYRFLDVFEASFESAPCLISRSGYTGEDGFEIIIPVEAGVILWTSLCDLGVRPCGLGARDILRLEMAYPLYGHELASQLRPNECGVEWALAKKTPFLGKEGIEAHTPVYETLGFVCEQKAIPRSEYRVEVNGQDVGMVTSGGLSPRLPNGFGLARVSRGSVDQTLDIIIRGKRIPAKRVPTPFIPDKVKR